MTEETRATPEDKPHLEVAKLQAEIGKLRSDNRFFNRHMAAIVSVVAAFIAGLQAWNTYSGLEAQAARGRQEQALKCVEMGVKVAAFIDEQIGKLKDRDAQGISVLTNGVIRTFPPAEAAAILRAMLVNLPPAVANQPGLRDQIEDIVTQLLGIDNQPGCARAEKVSLILAERAVPVAATAPVPAPVAPAAAAAAGCPALLPPPDAKPLNVVAQIVRATDRDEAQRILTRSTSLAPSLPVDGVENVNARNPAAQRAQVRFYFRDQDSQARWLARLLDRAACLEGLGTGEGWFQTSFIGDRFGNLPRGRIEVWFPKLDPAP